MDIDEDIIIVDYTTCPKCRALIALGDVCPLCTPTQQQVRDALRALANL